MTCVIQPLDAAGDVQILEELEIGRALERPKQLVEFLIERRLGAEEAEHAIDACRSWSAPPAVALLHVKQGHAGTSWETMRDHTEQALAAPGAPTLPVSGVGRPQRVASPPSTSAWETNVIGPSRA